MTNKAHNGRKYLQYRLGKGWYSECINTYNSKLQSQKSYIEIIGVVGKQKKYTSHKGRQRNGQVLNIINHQENANMSQTTSYAKVGYNKIYGQ